MRYGYSRVTMDDIAKAAGMSRPALYQSFRNKTDIYRAIADDMHVQAIAAAESALKEDKPARERIENVIRVGFLDILAELDASQHGAELLDMSNELCGDIIDEWKRRHLELLSQVYEAAATGSPFSGETLAWQLIDWLEGMKCRVSDQGKRIEALRAFLDLQFAALPKTVQPA